MRGVSNLSLHGAASPPTPPPTPLLAYYYNEEGAGAAGAGPRTDGRTECTQREWVRGTVGSGQTDNSLARYAVSKVLNYRNSLDSLGPNLGPNIQTFNEHYFSKDHFYHRGMEDW